MRRNTTYEVNFLYRGVYFIYEGEQEERDFPMELSQEFVEKFSEIFLDENVADLRL